MVENVRSIQEEIRHFPCGTNPLPTVPTGVLGGTVLDYGWEGVRGSLGSGLGLGLEGKKKLFQATHPRPKNLTINDIACATFVGPENADVARRPNTAETNVELAMGENSCRKQERDSGESLRLRLVDRHGESELHWKLATAPIERKHANIRSEQDARNHSLLADSRTIHDTTAQHTRRAVSGHDVKQFELGAIHQSLLSA